MSELHCFSSKSTFSFTLTGRLLKAIPLQKLSTRLATVPSLEIRIFSPWTLWNSSGGKLLVLWYCEEDRDAVTKNTTLVYNTNSWSREKNQRSWDSSTETVRKKVCPKVVSRFPLNFYLTNISDAFILLPPQLGTKNSQLLLRHPSVCAPDFTTPGRYDDLLGGYSVCKKDCMQLSG